jgi:cytochrome c-type biogenesis protein CcmH
MPDTVDWVPGLVVLALGLAGGFFVVRRTASSAAPARAAGALRRRDLEARRDTLLDQLREIGPGAGGPFERARLEREAAEVLRDIDLLGAAKAPAREKGGPGDVVTAAAPRRDHAALKGFLWGTASAGAIALLLFLASRSATEREEGGSLTGEVPGGGPGAAAEDDAELARLRQAVERNPDDLEGRLALARAALTRQDMMTVFDQTRAVLEREPEHARALSYQALVRLAMGQADTAEGMLRQALAAEPDLIEGYVHLSLVHLRQGRLDAAQADIEEAARRHPPQATRLRALWAEMKAQAAEAPEPGTASGEDPHRDLPEPAARAAAPAGGGVGGTVELAPGVKALRGATVFITVRAAGAAGGPPVAARRLSADTFPLPFTVGPGDSMMGQALPDLLRVEARVDGDGDPMTRDPADPSGAADDVRLGATGLRLVLRPAP